jgi:RNA polymerase sigma-70 factor, ECF subfamily
MALPQVPLSRSPEGASALERLRDGDDDAFEMIFRTWYAPLVRFATPLLRDAARAEEVVQDAMLELWRRRATVDVSGTPQAWLFRVVRNRALNVVRHEAITQRAAPALRVMLHLAEDALAGDSDAAVREAELHAAIAAAVDGLPPRTREVFLLSRRDGLRQTEIAARLGVSVKAVEARITHALRELRAALTPHLPETPRAR